MKKLSTNIEQDEMNKTCQSKTRYLLFYKSSHATSSHERISQRVIIGVYD